MREILFRGKSIDGNWYYGVPLVFTEDYVCITEAYKYNKSVIPSTVGQFTGLTDKNGKKIFEGDIIKVEHYIYHGEKNKKRHIHFGVVFYDVKFAQFGIRIDRFCNCFTLKRWKGDTNEVISNIYDNPELLEG